MFKSDRVTHMLSDFNEQIIKVSKVQLLNDKILIQVSINIRLDRVNLLQICMNLINNLF